MPSFDRGDVSLYYEEHGSGFPLLLIAPGGMQSSIPFWEKQPWNPIEALAPEFRVIAMDQRNAGRSRAPVRSGDGWHSYTGDQLALLDHLGVERTHILGGCIGGAYCLGLCQAAPERIASAVLQQPIGLSPDNRDAFYQMYDAWAEGLRKERSDVPDAVFAEMREAMYGGDFVFCVSRDFVRSCQTPLLVLRGNDLYHPSDTSKEIARIAPDASLVEEWKEGPDVGRAVERVREFLRAHSA